MQTMDQHLVGLCERGLITIEAAKQISSSSDLERKLMFTV
jgi:twitching motility protein PilT